MDRTPAPDGVNGTWPARKGWSENKNNKTHQNMKKIIRSFRSAALNHKRGAVLTAIAVLAVIALASSALRSRAQVVDVPIKQNTQTAEVLQLLSDYHGALANGGNIDAMASLWADGSSLTLNDGVPFVGKDAVLNFFATGPYFSHNWVSLAPEWKTTLTVNGNTAIATTECIATDVSVTPNVVRGVIQVNATCQKVNGKWLFIQMNNFSQPQI